MVSKFAQIRKDLLKEGLSVPVGESNYFGYKTFKYRWIGDDIFQIKFKNKWLEAYSIDWDFVSSEFPKP